MSVDHNNIVTAYHSNFSVANYEISSLLSPSGAITCIKAPLGESWEYCQIIVTCELVLLSEHESVQLFPVFSCRVSLQGPLSKACKCLLVQTGDIKPSSWQGAPSNFSWDFSLLY